MKTAGARCLITSLFAGGIIATLITGCATKPDSVTRAANTETNAPGTIGMRNGECGLRM